MHYSNTYAPVAHSTIARLLMSIGTEMDYEMDVCDIASAFLHAEYNNDEEVYIRPPPELTDYLHLPKDNWLKLNKTLYGSTIAPLKWHTCLTDFLVSRNFQMVGEDACL